MTTNNQSQPTIALPAMYDSLQSSKNAANFVPLTPISFLSRTADVYPEITSLIYEEQQYTWRETQQRCQQMAHALQGLGTKAHDTVSILAFNTPEIFEAHFFVPLAGCVINTINTRLDPATITYILDFAETKVLIVDRQLLPQATDAIETQIAKGNNIHVVVIDDPHATEKPDIAANLPSTLAWHEYNQLLNAQEITTADYLPYQIADELQPLAINFTSGTSGLPKGVVYHHRGSYLMTMGTIAGWPVPKHPVYMYTVPLFHCNGWGHAWTMTAMAATIVCVRAIIPEKIFTLMQQHKVSHFGGAPIVLNMLANSPECPERVREDATVYCMTAGAPPPASVLAKMEGMGFDIMHVYGLTESYGHILQGTPQQEWSEFDIDTLAEYKSRQGVRFPMTDAVAVIDPETEQPVAHDGETIGEIAIRSNTMMSGYLKDQQATTEAFEGGWFRSGDLAVIHPDGYVQVKDRAKDIIISGGENISSVEIENALYKHAAVGEAAVVAMKDEKWGETPCAFVELKPNAEVSESELIEHCLTYLARFKKPSKVIFGPLPKTATGKIQKYELRNRLKD
jgi:fatty-acyl-CoA synthase